MERGSLEPAYPRTYGRVDRHFLKSAYWAYVQGHDLGWEADRKRRAAAAILETEALERRRPGVRAGERSEREPDAASGRLERTGPRPPEAPRFGVPVPERLDFHRGPDTWRDRLGRPARGRA